MFAFSSDQTLLLLYFIICFITHTRSFQRLFCESGNNNTRSLNALERNFYVYYLGLGTINFCLAPTFIREG